LYNIEYMGFILYQINDDSFEYAYNCRKAKNYTVRRTHWK